MKMANTLTGETVQESAEEQVLVSSRLPTCGSEEHIVPTPLSPRATEEALERAAGIFRAAGDVARLRVLDLLMDGEQCVSALSQTLGVGMSTISQQLRLLREENVVTSRRAGKHIFYALTDDHVRDIVRSVLAHAGHCEYLSGDMGEGSEDADSVDEDDNRDS
jgi:ArsR family transcriptional regulator